MFTSTTRRAFPVYTFTLRAEASNMVVVVLHAIFAPLDQRCYPTGKVSCIHRVNYL